MARKLVVISTLVLAFQAVAFDGAQAAAAGRGAPQAAPKAAKAQSGAHGPVAKPAARRMK